MEKTINIDGRDVRFRSSGAFPQLYRAYAKRDLFADLIKMTEWTGDDGSIDFDKIDVGQLEDLVWCMAKCADKTIKDKYDWFDDFDSFPIFDVFAQLKELIEGNMQTSKKA